MPDFRDYKDYADTSTTNDFSRWISDSSYDLFNKIPSRTILRGLGDIIKYGRLKKDVLQ